MKYSATIKFASAMVALSMLASCSGGSENAETEGEVVIAEGTVPDSIGAEKVPDEPNVQAAVEGNYTASGDETVIKLSGDKAEINGDGAAFSDGELLLSSAGVYVLSGELDGRITVDTADEKRITLVLNGVTVKSADSPAVLVKNLPKKLVIYTAKDSVNILSDGADYVVPDEEQTEGEIYPNACVYSCEDLTLDGEGELYIYGNADKGVNTKDDLEILGGKITVKSVGVGMRGNDSVVAEGGEVYIYSGADGIKSANAEDAKGAITLSGCEFYIECAGDGISSATTLDMQSGKAVITTRDKDEIANSAHTEDTKTTFEYLRGPGGGGFPGGGMPGGGMPGEESADKSVISAKGLKAASTLTVSGGYISIDSADDGIHSDDEVIINGGEIYISAADDGIHADNSLTVNDGVIEIADSFEGIEAHVITLNGGVNRITATNDGANANGGTSGWGQPSSDSDSSVTPVLYINGGYTVINAEGDGLDSNGCVYMTGGTVIVYGPTNGGNGAIDYGDSRSDIFTISGGTLLAVGSSGMAQVATGDGQGVIFGNMRSLLAPESYIGILDAGGAVLAAYKLPKSISSVVFSSPEIKAGDTYTVVYGGEYDGDETDGVLTGGVYKNYSTLGNATAA